MPLYGGYRDISMFRHLAREVISSIVCEEVGYYKYALQETQENSYGESLNKFYYPPVLLNCLIIRGDEKTDDSEKGPDSFQQNEYRFLRDDLIAINIVCEVGDIIEYRHNFYEVYNTNENQFLFGKYPEYAMSDATYEFGSSWSVSCETNVLAMAKLCAIVVE